MAPRSLLAGLALLLAAGCGGGDGSDPQSSPEPKLSEEAQQALEEANATAPLSSGDARDLGRLVRGRARALDAVDLQALSATAVGRQRARDRRNARRAERLGADRIRFVTDDVQIDGRRGKLTAAMYYRVRGMSRTFRSSRRLTARKSDGRWRITREVARGGPLPWEVAAFEVSRAPHVVLFSAPGVDAAPLRGGLAAAYRKIRRDLPARDLPGSVLVIATSGPAQTKRLVGPVGTGVIGLADVEVVYGPAPAFAVKRVLGQRMVVVDSRLSALAPDARQGVLVHEMTHTALNPDTSGRAPAWLIEGVAMHVADEDRSEDARLLAAAGDGKSVRELCGREAIIRLRGSESNAAYAASSGAVEAIVERRGTKGLFRLYEAFNKQAFDGRTCAAMMNRVLRRTIGMSIAQLDAAVAGG